MDKRSFLLSSAAMVLAACGGNGTPQAATADFRRAAAGHRVHELFVAGAGSTALHTLVYLPREGGDGPYPTLVTRSPYDLPLTPISGFAEEHANAAIEARVEDIGWTEATDRGYALVIQFSRGRLRSDGVFSLFLDELADGDAMIAWVERQPWCNGRIGVFGDSASGVLALQAAAGGRASVKAVFAQATSPDFLGGVIFPDRRVKWEALLPFVLSQSLENSPGHDASLGLPAARIGELQGEAGAMLGELFDALGSGNPAASPNWSRPPAPDWPVVAQLQPRWRDLLAARENENTLATLDVTDRLGMPTMHVSLWHDFFQASAFEAFARQSARRSEHRLLVLDGTHYDIDEPDRWPARPMFDWFDHWLAGSANGVDRWPTVQYAIAGSPALGIRAASSWPPAGSRVAVALGGATGVLQLDASQPVPTLGGNHLIAAAGMSDQRALMARADVALLPGAPLGGALTIAGEAVATVQVAAAAAVELVFKLVDLRADGELRLVREAVARVEGTGTVSVRFAPIAYRFDAGSGIGLLVCGGSFPAFVSLGPAYSGEVRLGAAELALPTIT